MEHKKEELVNVLRALLIDIDAMHRPTEEDGEFWLSGFSESEIDADGEVSINWPNLALHREAIATYLEKISER